MNILLRSIFVADKSDHPDLAYKNFLSLQNTTLTFDVSQDSVIFTFVEDFCLQHNHSPDIATLRAHFNALNDAEHADRVEQLSLFQPLYRGDFEVRLNKRIEERRVRLVQDTLRDAAQITSTGLEIREGKDKRILFGPIAAMQYCMDRAHEIVTPVGGQKLSGEVMGDMEDFAQEYAQIEKDPTAGIGQLTGIAQLDDHLAGAKKQELWVHAAYTSHGKSMFMMNWAYNQAVYYGHSVLIFSLEMSYKQVRRILIAMHSLHPRFTDIRMKLGLQQDPLIDTGVLYKKIRMGRLSPVEKTFLFDYVYPDLMGKQVVPPYVTDPPGGYGKIMVEVANPDKADFTVADARSRAEVLYQKTPFQLLFLDHMGLMAPRKWVSNTTERLNEIVRDCKRLSMSFNHGQGIPVVGLFQIGREAFKAAEKAGNFLYNLSALSYANECIVPETWVTTRKGLKHIVDVQIGDEVWSRTGWKTVLDFFDQGERLTWRLTLDNNAQLVGTASHRIQTVKDGQFVWKELHKLTQDDVVVCAQGSEAGLLPTEIPLPPLEFDKYEHDDLATPTTMTPELAYLLGAWDGDGNQGGTGIRFTGNRKEADIEEQLQSCFEKTFGIRMSVCHSPSRAGSFDLGNTRRAFQRWFVALSGPRGKSIPNVILQGNSELRCQYLKGLFDTDGTINNQGVVSLASKHEQFLRDVQMLLDSVGIETFLGSKETHLKVTNKTYVSRFLNVRGWHSIQAFAHTVGFTDVKKRLRLEERLAYPPQRKCSDKRIPFYNEVVAIMQEHLPRGTEGCRKSLYRKLDKYRAEGSVPRDLVAYVDSLLQERGIVNPLLQKLLRGWSFYKVRDIQPTGKVEQVYDIEVSGDHEYQTGLLLSHNCERSADIVTTTYISDQMRKDNKIKFQYLKARDDGLAEPFEARVEWSYRRLLTCLDYTLVDAEKENIGDQLDLQALQG